MKYVVVGGAGAMGRITVKDLYETTKDTDKIVIADYDLAKAEELAKTFSKRVSAVKVDVNNHNDVVGILQGTEVLINSVQYQMNLKLMEIALDLKCHYIDLGGLFHYTNKQLELNERFKKINKLAIIGMGAAPGITNLLAKYCSDEMDSVNEIHIRLASKDKTKYDSIPALGVSYSLKTILEEFSYEPAVFTKGKFKFVKPMSGAINHKFPLPIGTQKPMFTIHSEVATLPLSYKNKGVKEVSFKIAFDHDFTAKVKFLRDLGMASHDSIKIGEIEVAPIDVINKIAMSQPIPKIKGHLNQYEIVRAIVKGTINNKKVTWVADCHCSGKKEWHLGTDINTGCPPSIVAQMLINGKINKTGVLPPEECIETKPFFEELEKREMFLKVLKKDGWSFLT
ncbi:MAG: saccharopine dehydrogenase C-terminal domain-containing protein [Candidatus Sericytochromatia bacterium]